MVFWRKKRNEIPPVVPASNLPSATTSASSLLYTFSNFSTSFARARGDNTPSARSPPYTFSNFSTSFANKSDLGPYNRNTGAGDVYSRGTAKLDEDRDALFSGNPTKSGSSRFFDGPGSDEKGDEDKYEEKDEEGDEDKDEEKDEEGDEDKDEEKDEEGDEDKDEEKIRKRILFVKKEGVESTRTALDAAIRARETGLETLSRLRQQGEKLDGTDDLLRKAGLHVGKAAENTEAIKRLNGTIFLPSFYKEGKKKYGVPEEASYEERKVSRYNFDDPFYDHLGDDRLRTTTDLEQASDDELEGELDDNLDQIGKTAGQLKQIAMAMGDELDVHNNKISHLARKADCLNVKLEMTTDRLRKIK
jgi:hypothetical protein